MIRSGVKRWFRLPVRRDDVAWEELEEEIRVHLELRVEQLMRRGLTAEEARAEAVRRFGDRGDALRAGMAREVAIRRAAWFADLRHDVRLMWRQVLRRPLFALAVVVVIALGIGANAAVFAVIDGALLRPLPFAAGHELVYLWDGQGSQPGVNPSYPEFRAWEREVEFLESITSLYGNGVQLRTDDGWEIVVGGMLSGDPRGTFGLEPLVGRWFTAEEVEAAAPVVMLDEAFWRDRFGGRSDVIGTQLALRSGPHTIVGVLPREAVLLRTGGEAALWQPVREDSVMVANGMHFLRVIGRLRDGLTVEEASLRAEAVADRIRARDATLHGLQVEEARKVLVGDSRRLMFVLMGAVFFVLIIVCANVANLFLSKFAEQSREFALRAALGAGRGRLLRQVLVQSILLSLAGGLCGLGLAHVMVAIVRVVVDRAGGLAASPGVDPRVIGFAVLLSILTGLVFGVWPALRATRFDVAGVLKEGDGERSAGSRSALRQRKTLVAAELAVSIMLLTGAGLLVRSMVATLREDPGFTPDNVLAFRVTLSAERYASLDGPPVYVAQALERLRALPGVLGAAAGGELPLEGSDTRGSFGIVGRDSTAEVPSSKKRVVSAGYFEALGIPVIRGRTFRDTDRAGAPDVVVISESLARLYWAGDDPIGKRVRFGWGPGNEQEIVGIVGDVRHDGLDQPIGGIMYRPIAQFPRRGMQFIVRTSVDPLRIAPSLRSEVRALDPSVPVFDVRTLDSIVSDSIGLRRAFMALLLGYAAIALVLAALGVYAVTAQGVSRRVREFGLRMAVGAGRRDILKMVVRGEARMIAIGLGLGLGGALLTTRLLSAFLYGVSTADPVTYIAAAALLGGIALAASLVPALRASRLDPISALHVR